jgi:hypothetical protein
MDFVHRLHFLTTRKVQRSGNFISFYLQMTGRKQANLSHIQFSEEHVAFFFRVERKAKKKPA